MFKITNTLQATDSFLRTLAVPEVYEVVEYSGAYVDPTYSINVQSDEWAGQGNVIVRMLL